MANVCLLAVIFTLLSAVSEGIEKHMICKDIEDVFSVDEGVTSFTSRRHMRGIPGKVGQKGAKGEAGDTGPPGPIAEIDYDRIEAEVERRVDVERRRLNNKFDRMEEQLQKRLNETEKMIEKLEWKISGSGLCNFTYRGKCFFGIFPTFQSETVNYQKAEELCSQHVASPANVYDSVQYEMLATYMRSEIPSGGSVIHAWLGMKANVSAGTYTLTSGEPVSISNWYPSFPHSFWSFTGMGIHIDRSKTSSSQGMYNNPPTYARHGVICEM